MADESVLTNRSTDLVTFTVLIDDEEIGREYNIFSISVAKEINRIPRARIIIRDGDVAEQDFSVSSSDLFVPGKEVEIKAGYHSDDETIFKGLIIKHGIKTRASGNSLVIDCKDKTVQLTTQPKSACYSASKDSDILTTIIENYGLDAEVEDTAFEHPEMIQYYSTDWDFLVCRAETNGLLTFVDDGSVSISAPDLSQESVFTTSFGNTIIEFEAEMDAANQLSSVKSISWNSADQELIESEGAAPGFSEQGNFSLDELSAVLNSDELLQFHGGDIETELLQKWGDAKLLKSHLAKIRGRLKIQGYALVKPGNLITLQGLGDRFNGNAFVSAVVHQITDGEWFTDIQIGIDPEWFSKKNTINEKPASGLVPAINGLHIGLVVKIGGDEKDGDHRIMISLPFLENYGGTDSEGIWARLCNVFSGNERGMIFRPEIGDEVLVGFINDDPRDPVILGAFNSSSSPAPNAASDDNFEKGIYNLGKMNIVFNDDKKSLLLETKSGNSVLLSEDEAGIIITDENSNKIKMSSDGIEIESSKDLVLKAPKGDIKTSAKNIEGKASVNYKAEGASTKIAGSGSTEIKGGIVKIN